jgi:hypothetical protein
MPSQEAFAASLRPIIAIVGITVMGSVLTGSSPALAVDRPGTSTNVTAIAQDATVSRPPSVRVSPGPTPRPRMSASSSTPPSMALQQTSVRDV